MTMMWTMHRAAVALVAVLEVVDVRGVLLMRVVPHAGEVHEGAQSRALQATEGGDLVEELRKTPF